MDAFKRCLHPRCLLTRKLGSCLDKCECPRIVLWFSWRMATFPTVPLAEGILKCDCEAFEDLLQLFMGPTEYWASVLAVSKRMDVCKCAISLGCYPFRKVLFRKLQEDDIEVHELRFQRTTALEDCAFPVFWQRLRFFITTILSKHHHYDSSSRPTLRYILCELGLHCDRLFNLGMQLSAPDAIDLQLPDRRYWFHVLEFYRLRHHTVNDFVSTYKENVASIILFISRFAAYISSACPQCTELCAMNGYRFHSEYGIQVKNLEGAWEPDPIALARRISAAVEPGRRGRSRSRDGS